LHPFRRALTAIALAATLTLAAAPAWAGSPHFVDDKVTLTRSGDALTASGKVAGLGDETQITVTVTADVQCVNPGNNEPQAENKGATVAEGTAPVSNGKAVFSVTGTGVVDPSAPCPGPQTLAYSDVVVTVSGDSFDPDLVFRSDSTF